MAHWRKDSHRARSKSGKANGALTKSLRTLFLVLSAVLPARADALLPTVILISPIMILLLVPIIAIEAWYVSSRLKLRLWKATRIMALANVASTIVGFPITMAVSYIQHKVLVYIYGSEKANFDKWMTTGDQRARAFSFGHYPGWVFLLSAFATLVVCFLASWWVESIAARWRLKQQAEDNQLSTQEISKAVRNANILSYSFLAPIVLLFLARLSFPQF